MRYVFVCYDGRKLCILNYLSFRKKNLFNHPIRSTAIGLWSKRWNISRVNYALWWKFKPLLILLLFTLPLSFLSLHFSPSLSVSLCPSPFKVCVYVNVLTVVDFQKKKYVHIRIITILLLLREIINNSY